MHSVLMRPDSNVKVGKKQGLQKLNQDRHANQRECHVGDNVMAQNCRDGHKWMVGLVVERKGPLSYVVQMDHGMLWRRHID